MTAGRPDNEPRPDAANPHMHSGWNSNNPKSSSMEFHRAGGRQINHRRCKQVTPGRTATRGQGGGAGGGERFENNPRPPSTALAGCEIVYTSKDGSSFRYSCYKLLWEPCRHRLTLHFLCTRLAPTILQESGERRRVGFRSPLPPDSRDPTGSSRVTVLQLLAI